VLKVCIHNSLVGEKTSEAGQTYEVRCGNCIAERINKNGMWRFDKEGNLRYITTYMFSIESKLAELGHKVADLDSAVAKLDDFVSLLASKRG
jgi:hypothetical protein